MITAFLLGIIIGIVFWMAVRVTVLFVRLRISQSRECEACGRPAAILGVIVDLKTGRTRQAALLCEACNGHGQSVAAENPPPWIKR